MELKLHHDVGLKICWWVGVIWCSMKRKCLEVMMAASLDHLSTQFHIKWVFEFNNLYSFNLSPWWAASLLFDRFRKLCRIWQLWELHFLQLCSFIKSSYLISGSKCLEHVGDIHTTVCNFTYAIHVNMELITSPTLYLEQNLKLGTPMQKYVWITI